MTDEHPTTEIWKPVVGFERFYDVSNLGRVRSARERILKSYVARNGYIKITLQGIRSSKGFTVHSLVAAAFIGERPTGYHINHLDGDKTNNRADNLAYCTPEENELHASALGLKARGSRNGQSRLSESDVRDIKRRLKDGEQPTTIAADFGVRRATVYAIMEGKNWSHL